MDATRVLNGWASYDDKNGREVRHEIKDGQIMSPSHGEEIPAGTVIRVILQPFTFTYLGEAEVNIR